MAAALGAAVYYFNHVNNEIRQRVLARLAGHYQGLKVDVRTAFLVDGEGIEIRGVSISDPSLPKEQAELIYLDEMVLSCRTELQEFLRGEPEITHVLIRRPRLRATRLADGRWTAAKLLPYPKFSKRRIATTIENAVVELIDADKFRPTTFTLREIHLQLNPLNEEHADGDEPVQFKGSLAGDYFQRIDLEGRIEPQNRGLTIDGQLLGLDLSPELREALPAELKSRLEPLAALRAECGVEFHVRHRPGQPQETTFSVAGELSRGRFDDPRLPQALTELFARFRADNGGVFVDAFSARSGHSTVHGFGQRFGFQPKSPLYVDLKADHLLVGRHWESILTGKLREQWQKIHPAGEVDAHLRLSYDGARWTPDLTVRCLNVSFTYHKFPYRLDRGVGVVELKDQHLSLNLRAFAGGRPVAIQGEVDNPGPAFTGRVTIEGADLTVDQNMIAALPEKPRGVVQSLNPSGTFDFYMRLKRDDPAQPRVSQFLRLDVKNGSVRYDKFPYPIANIHGRIEMDDGRWTVGDACPEARPEDALVGRNDRGTVACSGGLTPDGDGALLWLDFVGSDIALEEELRDALPPKVQKVWNDLNPRGSLELKHAGVRYHSATRKPQITVKVEPRGETVSIEPVYFPYRLDQVQGQFQYQDGRVVFGADARPIHAVHARVPVAASGFCLFNDQGDWRLRFTRLSAERVRADRDLLVALPPRLRKVVGDFNPSGPVNIDGMLELSGGGVPGTPVRSSWDLDFNVQQTSLSAGVPLDNVSGSIRLVGQHDGAQLRCGGSLALDSVTFRDFQFTQVHGPLSIDDRQLLLGEFPAHSAPARLPRKVTAKLSGGTVLANVWVGLSEPPKYHLEATLTDADLQRFAREQLAGKQNLKGNVAAGIVLDGAGTSLHGMSGRGEVRLREADIYELPVMVQLLKILSIRRPDTTGFTTSDIAFRVEGEHIYLDKIELSGDAISLVGSGEMNFDTAIRANLGAIVGRSELQLPVLKNMMGQASQQILQVRVDGTLAEPQIRREAFPGLNQAFQQLQADMQPMRPQFPLPSAFRRIDRR